MQNRFINHWMFFAHARSSASRYRLLSNSLLENLAWGTVNVFLSQLMCLLLGLYTFPYIDLSMAVSGRTWGNLTFTMLEKALDWATTSMSLWTMLAWLIQTTLLSSTKFYFQWPVRYSSPEESADICFVSRLLLKLLCSLNVTVNTIFVSGYYCVFLTLWHY